MSYLPISSYLILFSFLSSLSSFLDFPVLRTSLDISTLITYIFLEIKTLEYWVTLALSQSRRKESSSLPQVSVCFYHYFLQKLYANVNNIKHSKCTNFQLIISFFNIYLHPYFLFSIYDFVLLILRWSGHWQYHVEAQHSCSKGRRSSSDRYARTRHIKLCLEIFKFVHKGKKLFSIYFMMLNFLNQYFLLISIPIIFS